jgi:hypothetical protein
MGFFSRTWSNSPEMPTWTAFSGVAPSSDRKQLYSVGGFHPKNAGPWPTEYIYSDMIAAMDYDTVGILFVWTRLSLGKGVACSIQNIADLGKNLVCLGTTILH